MPHDATGAELLRLRKIRQQLEDAQRNSDALTGRPMPEATIEEMVARRMASKRRAADPQDARWKRYMAANIQRPAPYADTPEDIARKEQMGMTITVPGVDGGSRTVNRMELSEARKQAFRDRDNERYDPNTSKGADYQASMARRRTLGSQAASRAKARNAMNAYNRGALNPAAESGLASQGLIPDRRAQMIAAQLAMVQAQHPTAQHGDPMKAKAVKYFNENPAEFTKYMQGQIGEEPIAPPMAPALPPGGGITRTNPDGSTTIMHNGKLIKIPRTNVDAVLDAPFPPGF